MMNPMKITVYLAFSDEVVGEAEANEIVQNVVRALVSAERFGHGLAPDTSANDLVTRHIEAWLDEPTYPPRPYAWKRHPVHGWIPHDAPKEG